MSVLNCPVHFLDLVPCYLNFWHQGRHLDLLTSFKLVRGNTSIQLNYHHTPRVSPPPSHCHRPTQKAANYFSTRASNTPVEGKLLLLLRHKSENHSTSAYFFHTLTPSTRKEKLPLPWNSDTKVLPRKGITLMRTLAGPKVESPCTTFSTSSCITQPLPCCWYRVVKHCKPTTCLLKKHCQTTK